MWGIGEATALRFVAKGFRTLQDLRDNSHLLTANQLIGLQVYDDIKERIGRAEVKELFQTVKEAAEQIVPGVEAEVCGSYRRGKPTWLLL